MIKMSFLAKLQKKWAEKKFVCVGLDQSSYQANKKVVDATYDLVCAYKPNTAFYEADGISGLENLKKIIHYIQTKAPDILIILDAKRGDIGSTNEGYTKAAFENFKVDAITVNPYPGKIALQPFLDYKDKGIIFWVRTSNPGAGEFQDLKIKGESLFTVIARHIANDWNENGNCSVVVGATYPKELAYVRKIVGDMPILIPGIGAQGGDLQATIKAGKNSQGQGMIISSSRGIIFAPDPREATLKLHQDILNSLKK